MGAAAFESPEVEFEVGAEEQPINEAVRTAVARVFTVRNLF